MDRFIGRQAEIAELNRYLDPKHGHLLSVYGRRRVGKTTLLIEWAKQTGLPYLYWVAKRETPAATRQSLAQAMWNWAHPQSIGMQPPEFGGWEALFQDMAARVGDTPTVIIFDEFPYAQESDPSLASHLQAAWDHHFKERPVLMVLSGSHIGMMVNLSESDAPLHGRFSAEIPIDPLPFRTLTEFFPRYEEEERVELYAVLGGIPAYLERFSPDLTLRENIQEHLYRRSGLFRSDPGLIVSDLLRETRVYESVLRSVAQDNHVFSDIARSAGITNDKLSPYLRRLVELRLVERRVPATIPLRQLAKSRMGRYYLRDPYLRFYFRFIEPYLSILEYGSPQALWDRLEDQFNQFVGLTAFEDLCREWVLAKAKLGELPFAPEIVGQHWASDAQIDVVAINWREKTILLGECKWYGDALQRSVLADLAAKTDKVVPGPDWKVHYAIFSRRGLFPLAWRDAKQMNALVVDTRLLDEDLARAG